MTIARITLRRLYLPLISPYRLSYRTFTEFEPFLVEIAADDGRIAWGDAHISPGSSAETREGGWRHLTERLPGLLGQDAESAMEIMARDFADSKVATSAPMIALEVLADTPLSRVETDAALPLLVPVAAQDAAGIHTEVNQAIAAGFRTLKVKVGKDVAADLQRLAMIQAATAGRAELRIDANRAYSRTEAIAFVRGADPTGIALFEQPCHADAWDDNAAVAGASDIPVMLDEPICTLDDIARAAEIDGVGFCKVKLKRFGGLRKLHEGIRAIHEHGMQAVLGDGLGSDLHAWFEAAIASRSVANAGEYNGFLKMTRRVLAEPLAFGDGRLSIRAGPAPAVDRAAVAAVTQDQITFQT